MLHKEQLLENNPLVWIIDCIDSFICIWELLKSICGHVDSHITFIFIFAVKAAFKLHCSYHHWVRDVIHTILKVGVKFFGISCILSLLKSGSGFLWCLWSLIFWCVLISCVVAVVILITICLILLNLGNVLVSIILVGIHNL